MCSAHEQFLPLCVVLQNWVPMSRIHSLQQLIELPHSKCSQLLYLCKRKTAMQEQYQSILGKDLPDVGWAELRGVLGGRCETGCQSIVNRAKYRSPPTLHDLKAVLQCVCVCDCTLSLFRTKWGCGLEYSWKHPHCTHTGRGRLVQATIQVFP